MQLKYRKHLKSLPKKWAIVYVAMPAGEGLHPEAN